MSTTLFVCHEGQRTGAPLLLLWLIRWLVANTSIRPVVALMREGPLQEEFSAVCPTYTFARPVQERWHRRLRRKFSPTATNDPDGWLASIVAEVKPDCLYLNTLVLGASLARLELDRSQTRVISHAHEMEIGLLLSSTPADIKTQLDSSDKVICCAESVKQNLLEIHHASPSQCIVIPEYIPYSKPDELMRLHCNEASQPVVDTLQKLRDEGVFLFGFAGSPIDRKGFDLFPQLVKICASQFGGTPFRAVWVGCGPGSLPYVKANRDLRLLGVSEHALLLPGVSCGAAALRQLDVMALLAREDPYPVVALEAGAMGIPTVCFRQSGGIADLAEQGYGVAVDYLNLDAFAAAIHKLQRNPDESHQLGNCFQERIFNTNTVEIQGAAIASIIQSKA
jgi:glycosyltransferase involved in cell wall biosynthesis